MKRMGIQPAVVFLVTAAFSANALAADTPINSPTAKHASKIVTPLVRAYDRCTVPNTSHVPPYTGHSCVPPVESSSLEFGPKGWGTFTIQHVSSNTKDYNGDTLPDSPTDSDIVFTTKLYNIVDATSPGMQPYSGAMGGGNVGVRLTGTNNLPVAGDGSGTMSDTLFPMQDPPGQDCVNGTCKIVSSVDATVPGLVLDGKQATVVFGVSPITGSGQLELNDAGGNPFATSGIVIP